MQGDLGVAPATQVGACPGPNVLIYVLLGAAVITAVMGHWVDTAVIALVAVVNATIGFVQEGRAEKALEGLSDMLSPEATVRRDGSWTEIDAEEVDDDADLGDRTSVAFPAR